MINPGEFKLYNASAGAGKTFTLVRNILTILLRSSRDNWFEHVLAITFTNKAANEMKERILGALTDLANPKNQNSQYLHDLSRDLEISPDEIQSKAKAILTNILHNYSKFSISTIDKFNLRLIKAFAQDLGLAVNFDVEIDSNELVEQAVNLLYTKIGEDAALTSTIIDIAMDQMEDDQSWDVKQSLVKNTSKLSNDIHLDELNKLINLNLSDFNQYRKHYTNSYRNLLKKFDQVAIDCENLLQNNQLTTDDLPGKSRSIGAFFLKYKAYDGKEIRTPSATLCQQMEDGSFVDKAKHAAHVYDDLKGLYDRIQRLNQELILTKAILKNISSISLLNEIKKALEEIKSENNTLLINEFNALISKNLQNQPTPFIYEKIGSKFRHYFIDEFQDTSTLQWENLKPLIENADAQDDTIMLVGDVKQSIYRWRGGNPNQMIDISENWPDILNENLETNWRSFENVIQFNNDLYQYVGGLMEWEKYRETYALGSQQKANDKKGGYVNVQFLAKNETQTITEVNLEKIGETISNLLENNFKLNEIAILVRTNVQGAAVAEYLAEKKYPIISNDSLLLRNSAEIQFIEAILNVVNQPQDFQAISKSILLANQIGLIETQDFTVAIQDAIKHSPKSFVKAYQNFGYDLKFITDENLSLYDFIEKLIRTFPFSKTASAYLFAFLDEVLDFTSKNESNIQRFLEHWSSKRERLSIQTPKGIDAIQIMTIHKSKGLEFPVVILPFVNWAVKDNNDIWIPLEKSDDQPFESFFVNMTKDLQLLEDENIRETVNIEKNLNQLDTFNTFYVATTRAVEQLYILSEVPPKSSSTLRVNQILYNFLETKKLLNEDLNIDVFGTPERQSEPKESTDEVENIPFISNDWMRNLRVSTNSEKAQKLQDLTAYANAIHSILSNIISIEDLDKAIDIEIRNGLLKPEEIEAVRSKILNIITHPNLEKYFDKNLVILNERDFIDQNGEVFRADRVIIDEQKVSILDYKTGVQDISHHSQIDHYANFFKNLGYQIDQKILVYLRNDSDENEIVAVN